jgi:hypothetical protein
MGIFDFLGGPLKGLVDGIGGIFNNLHTSEEEKLKAQRELLALQAGFQLEMAKVDAEWAKTQASVINAEIHSQSWAARNWRPILMLTFCYIIAHNYVLSPMFHLERVEIPPDMWTLLDVGVGGYIVSRGAEKIVPGVVASLKK